MSKAMEIATKIASRYLPEWTWLQVATVDHSHSLPWVCVDCRTGTIHSFKCVDDARSYAASEDIAFFL